MYCKSAATKRQALTNPDVILGAKYGITSNIPSQAHNVSSWLTHVCIAFVIKNKYYSRDHVILSPVNHDPQCVPNIQIFWDGSMLSLVLGELNFGRVSDPVVHISLVNYSARVVLAHHKSHVTPILNCVNRNIFSVTIDAITAEIRTHTS